MVEEVKVDCFWLVVEVFGIFNVYNNWIFVLGLLEDVELKLMYVGEGMLWIDMN